MARTARPEPLTGDAIVRRTPRVFRYLANVFEADQSGDREYSLEAPSDLPMDEATFVATIYAACELAELASLTPDQLREHAEQMQAALDGIADQSAPAEPAPAPPTTDSEDCDHAAVHLADDGEFYCNACETLVP